MESIEYFEIGVFKIPPMCLSCGKFGLRKFGLDYFSKFAGDQIIYLDKNEKINMERNDFCNKMGLIRDCCRTWALFSPIEAEEYACIQDETQ